MPAKPVMDSAQRNLNDYGEEDGKSLGIILRQNPNNDSNIIMTWAPEGRIEKERGPKTAWRRTVDKERARERECWLTILE